MSLNDGGFSSTCFSRSRSSTHSVMSISTSSAKSGAVAFDSAIRRETVRCRRVSSCTCSSPRVPASPAGAGSAGLSSAPGFSFLFLLLLLLLLLVFLLLPLLRLGRLLGSAAVLAGGLLDVGLQDPPAGTGALNVCDVDAELVCDTTRDGRRLGALVVAFLLASGFRLLLLLLGLLVSLGLGFGLFLLGFLFLPTALCLLPTALCLLP